MTGAEQIVAERRRQIEVEGYTIEHDSGHPWQEIGKAGTAYVLSALANRDLAVELWPWESKYWKPTNPLRDLVRAGALIAATIDRLTDTWRRTYDPID